MLLHARSINTLRDVYGNPQFFGIDPDLRILNALADAKDAFGPTGWSMRMSDPDARVEVRLTPTQVQTIYRWLPIIEATFRGLVRETELRGNDAQHLNALVHIVGLKLLRETA